MMKNTVSKSISILALIVLGMGMFGFNLPTSVSAQTTCCQGLNCVTGCDYNNRCSYDFSNPSDPYRFCPGGSILCPQSNPFRVPCSLCNNTCGGVRAPAAPINVFPANGASLPSGSGLTLSWSHSDFGSCGGNSCSGSCASTAPRNYTIQITGPQTINTNTTATSVTVSLSAKGQYTWVVYARNACTYPTAGVATTFFINTVPTALGLILSNEVCTVP